MFTFVFCALYAYLTCKSFASRVAARQCAVRFSRVATLQYAVRFGRCAPSSGLIMFVLNEWRFGRRLPVSDFGSVAKKIPGGQSLFFEKEILDKVFTFFRSRIEHFPIQVSKNAFGKPYDSIFWISAFCIQAAETYPLVV